MRSLLRNRHQKLLYSWAVGLTTVDRQWKREQWRLLDMLRRPPVRWYYVVTRLYIPNYLKVIT